jgi:hypothetical protein
MARLEAAPSNLEGVNGKVVYEREVSPYVSVNGIGHMGAN